METRSRDRAGVVLYRRSGGNIRPAATGVLPNRSTNDCRARAGFGRMKRSDNAGFFCFISSGFRVLIDCGFGYLR